MTDDRTGQIFRLKNVEIQGERHEGGVFVVLGRDGPLGNYNDPWKLHEMGTERHVWFFEWNLADPWYATRLA